MATLIRRSLSNNIVKTAFLTSRRLMTQGEGKSTHFGYEQVTEKEKTEKVYKVFKNVSSRYDTMNDMMSLGIHRLWKDKLIQMLNPVPGTKLLDVAGGTGDIAFRFLNYANCKQSLNLTGEQAEVIVCDINKNMLKVGKKRAKQTGITKGISWVAGDAESLPMADNSFDAYTIAFGIRNVTHIEKALRDAHRVLKPGGRFMCLEFTQLTNPVLQNFGEVIAGDWKSYQYLVESIRQFPDQETFAGMIEDSGFRMVTYKNLSSGIIAIHSGFKL